VIKLYKLESLSYSYEALEPFIDTHTLGLHHLKHELGYVNKLNELLIKNNYDYRYNLVELNFHLSEFSKESREDILFNLGGVINHVIYFNSMSPNKEKPNMFLNAKINEDLKNFDNFKRLFKESALKLKGSGYTFLVLDYGKLKIINLKNQDNPYYYGYIPIVGIDMWEHAYYINYENKKDLYIDNFLEILDFKRANELFEK